MNADKCTETISIKVTPAIKAIYEALPDIFKKLWKKAAILALEKIFHDSRFKEGMYIGDEHHE